MPRKSKLKDESAEVGRLIGAMERIGYKELIDEVRAQAKAEGKNVSDKLAEIIKIGLTYEKYKDLTLADAMKVMDFIERAFNNFLYPVMYTSRSMIDQAELERIKVFAEALGYIPRQLAEQVIREREQQLIEALAEQQQQEKMPETKPQGPVTIFITRLAEKLADAIGEELITRLLSEGKLEDFISILGETTKKAVEETLAEAIAEKGAESQQ